MPVDPTSELLAAARDGRLLPLADIDALTADPGRPHTLPELADWLLAREAVTPFQADRAKAGLPIRIGGYTLAADLGPVPDGHEYLARHPSLKDTVIVRTVTTADPDGFADRARQASTVSHPHLSHLLDAGVHDGQAFAAVEPFDGRPLAGLVRDIGPMPTALACGYARQAADALAAAHARGLTHGAVRADVLHVGPLVESSRSRRPDGSPVRRPAGHAAAKLFDLGLSHDPAPPDPAADVAGLGYTLAFLLAGRPLSADELRAARPDLPVVLLELIAELQATRPSAADAADRLAAFAGPAVVVPVPAPAPPSESGILPGGGSLTAPMVAPPAVAADEPVVLADASPGEWVATPYDGPSGENRFVLPDGSSSGTRFAAPADERRRPPPGKPLTAEERGKLKKLLWVGVGFWAVGAVLGLFLVARAGCFGGGEESQPPPVKKNRR